MAGESWGKCTRCRTLMYDNGDENGRCNTCGKLVAAMMITPPAHDKVPDVRTVADMFRARGERTPDMDAELAKAKEEARRNAVLATEAAEYEAACAAKLSELGVLQLVRPPFGSSTQRIVKAHKLVRKANRLLDGLGFAYKPVGATEFPNILMRNVIDFLTYGHTTLRYERSGEPPAATPDSRTADAFLQNAIDLLRERGKQYDQPSGERSMGKTVAAFNAIAGRDLSEAEGWLLMLLLKQVRQWQTGTYHKDSAEDSVSYSALLAEALERSKGKC